MENTETTNVKGKGAEKLLMGLGIILILCNCLYMSTAFGLDIFGNKAPGTLTVDHYPCAGGKGRTCQTVDIEYVDDTGNKNYIYYGGILPILWDAIAMPEDGSHSWDVEVRYLQFLFVFSKEKLPFHLEYLDPMGKKTIWTALKVWLPVLALFWWLRYGKKKKQPQAISL